MAHHDLQVIKARLLHIHNAISNFRPLTARPPILDSAFEAAAASGENNPGDNEENQWLQQESIPGLKKLRESIKVDLGVLEKFLDDPNSVNLPPLSTNAPYLVAVWNELICAPAPIVSIFKTFPSHAANDVPITRGPPTGTKVDIVADNGRHWIRVNTVKNARMLSEFREIDSYLTDSEGESDKDWDDIERPSLAQAEFDNSVLKMGRGLLQAAHANPIEGTGEIPRVTLRLTRLDPNLPSNELSGTPPDPRIAQTLDTLRSMGIEVALGEQTDRKLLAAETISTAEDPSSSSNNIVYTPTENINLDLSVLIALISDLTHAHLPHTIEEANRRFVPPAEYRAWKQKRQVMNGKSKSTTLVDQPETVPEAMETDINDLPRDLIKHARALTNQLLQEMSRGMLQEIHDRIYGHLSGPKLTQNATTKKIVFWTTPEARDRCLRIVSKIGGVHEKRRARALFCLAPPNSEVDPNEIPALITAEEAERLYWLDSRFERGFIPFLPICIFPSVPHSASDPPSASTPSSPDHPTSAPALTPSRPPKSSSTFGVSLHKVCTDILSQETIAHPRALARSLSNATKAKTATTSASADEGQLHVPPASEIQRATVTKANPRLTAHTVQSLQWGAALGWTTLTANRTSVKAILREMKAARVAGRLAGVSARDKDEEEDGDAGTLSGLEGGAGGHASGAEWTAIASIWIVDPRSLAEGMSSLPPARVISE
ncbi:hypothetical protein GALMADRAFT_70436 [Galerina marginata CBS 339.88]|uniref:DUF1308 domain-containing protein n=1 Tax=Galerina marginata (strain CBS 339.88) TaxID=685588 RepID=A0A067T768_GALM3|nr:hypothetical protein GALMADRAFT_70436 [Galerina marginata CBS 339.88]